MPIGTWNQEISCAAEHVFCDWNLR